MWLGVIVNWKINNVTLETCRRGGGGGGERGRGVKRGCVCGDRGITFFSIFPSVKFEGLDLFCLFVGLVVMFLVMCDNDV